MLASVSFQTAIGLELTQAVEEAEMKYLAYLEMINLANFHFHFPILYKAKVSMKSMKIIMRMFVMKQQKRVQAQTQI